MGQAGKMGQTGMAIVAEGLVKRYGKVVALDGLNLTVPEGTVMGLLGPNGAGKTTAVRMLTTLLRPDAGSATVAGLDVVRDAAQLKTKIGASGQYAAVDEYLTGFENLEMVGRLYHIGGKRAKARANELLERFDLTEAAHRPVKGYSGGMRRRLDLAGALVVDPPVVFLDEPTTGLDPRARLSLWDVMSELVAAGTTLLLTTQYLEEADRLADKIAVIDHGKVIAEGTSDQLKDQIGGQRVELTVANDQHYSAAYEALERYAPGQVHGDRAARELNVSVSGGSSALVDIIGVLRERDVEIRDVGLRRPTLDDVFLSLTGHAPADDAKEMAMADAAAKGGAL